MIVKVKQKHIDSGIAGEPDKCALALALLDNGFENPCVGRTVWQFPGFRLDLPENAQKFVAALMLASTSSHSSSRCQTITKSGLHLVLHLSAAFAGCGLAQGGGRRPLHEPGGRGLGEDGRSSTGWAVGRHREHRWGN
jgi:hypothetical protein